ncbi:DUF305 domain-containing protein [Streptomyces sp. NPDC059740]|uniref:DUF305 domain-containing protein n=1 Tax=Streptomyces sp. NPDC059740 TaxID=3346926 RepID=UPI00365B25C6
MTPSHPLARRATAAAAAVTAAVVLAGCGAGTDSPDHAGHDAAPSAAASATADAHNARDVAFAQHMIPHHRQALAMAGLVPSRAKSQQLKDLAARIRKAQGPEITTMSGWLRAWGEHVPSDTPSAGPSGAPTTPGTDGTGDTGATGATGDSAGHSGHATDGMMSDADMAKLAKLSGAAFDTAFLKMMVGHHQGAVDMARDERAKGAYGPARALARSVATSQTAEIRQMEKMLGE